MAILYAHTCINTLNLKKLCDFYEKVFELTYVGPSRELQGQWFDKVTGLNDVHVDCIHMTLPGFPKGGPTVEFFTWENTEEKPNNNINTIGLAHIAFNVDDVEKTYKMLVENGGSAYGEMVKNYSPIKDMTITIIYAKDPDGNIIEISKWEDGDWERKVL